MNFPKMLFNILKKMVFTIISKEDFLLNLFLLLEHIVFVSVKYNAILLHANI